MKKILTIFFLAIVLALNINFLIAGNINAQELKRCCVLRSEVTLQIRTSPGTVASITCGENTAVGEKVGLTDYTRSCAPTGSGISSCTSFQMAFAGDEAGQNRNWGMFCLVGTINSIANWVFYILLIVAVLMIVIGGFVYMTAAGDPEKSGKGKNILIFAIIGLVIALLAKIIPSIVKFFLGV